MKAAYLTLLIFCFSCSSSDKKDILHKQDSLASSNTAPIQKKTSASLESYYKSVVPQMVDSLKKRGYKFPSHEAFRNKILEIAHHDIHTASKDILHAVAGNADAIISERFFLPKIQGNGRVESMHVTAAVEYNNMIMYDKPTEYYYEDSPLALEFVSKCGYIHNEDLLKIAFGQTAEARYEISNLLFDYSDAVGALSKYSFRYSMLQKMVEQKAGLLTNLPTSDLKQYQLSKGEYYKVLCHLLNAECSIRTDDATGVWMEYPYGGHADIYFIEQPEVRMMFKKNNYWGLKYIQEYDKIYNLLKITYYDMNGNSGHNHIYDYVVDKDGYANVRKEANTNSEVVFKVNSYERLEILDENQGFYKIKYNGKEGFVHQSRF